MCLFVAGLIENLTPAPIYLLRFVMSLQVLRLIRPLSMIPGLKYACVCVSLFFPFFFLFLSLSLPSLESMEIFFKI